MLRLTKIAEVALDTWWNGGYVDKRMIQKLRYRNCGNVESVKQE